MHQQPDVFDLRAHLAQNLRRVDKILDDLESGNAPEPGVDRVKLGAAAEIRQTIALAQKAVDTANAAQAAQRFEQYIIDLLAKQSPHVRKQLIGKLNEARNNRQNRQPESPAEIDEP